MLESRVMAPNQKRPRISARRRRRMIEGYLYLSPWAVGFVAFVGGPIIYSILISLTQFSVLAPPVFVGLQNYVYAFTGDALVIPSFLRTFYYAVVYVPLALAGSLLIAILLNQRLRPISLWRTFFFLPTLTPSVAMALLWTWILNPQIGVANYVLSLVGIQGPRWFASITWAIPSLILVALWGSIGGTTMIIFLAGLQQVPRELVEAAEIDGAGRLAKAWHVTVPMISPVIFFNLIIGIIGALNIFDTAFVATGGGPAYATWFISLQIYTAAFRNFEMGYAAALSWILAIIVFVLTFIQFRLSGRWVFYQGKEQQ